jgi:hypothetical protein
MRLVGCRGRHQPAFYLWRNYGKETVLTRDAFAPRHLQGISGECALHEGRDNSGRKVMPIEVRMRRYAESFSAAQGALVTNRGRTMARRVGEVVWYMVLLGTLIASTFSQAATMENESSEAASPLVTLAEVQFPNLSEAERRLLLFADLKQRAQGEFALAGPRAAVSDASNDPAHAEQWNHEREVRGELIRWLSVDPDASRLVDPRGIRLLAARVTGRLDLSQVHVPFPIVLRNCAIPERLAFAAANILSLDLGGSHIGEMDAPGIEVDNDLRLDSGFQAAGEVNVAEARIGGALLTSGHFKSSALDFDLFDPKNKQRRAFYGLQMRIGGSLVFRDVHIDGGLELSGSTIGADLVLDGSFVNPGMTAIDASSTDIARNVDIGYGVPFVSDGLVNFVTARISWRHVATIYASCASYSHRSNLLTRRSLRRRC